MHQYLTGCGTQPGKTFLPEAQALQATQKVVTQYPDHAADHSLKLQGFIQQRYGKHHQRLVGDSPGEGFTDIVATG